MKEYGPDQYEVTIGPSQNHRAADESLILREVTRMTAARCGEAVTFTPIQDPATVGNGVHIHMSFVTEAGEPATYDAAGVAGMSPSRGPSLPVCSNISTASWLSPRLRISPICA